MALALCPRPRALPSPSHFLKSGRQETLRHGGEEARRGWGLSAPACLWSGAPPLEAGPTSSKVSRCSKVSKIIQTDDINDGAHHAGVVLGERTWDGVRPGAVNKGPAACSRRKVSEAHHHILSISGSRELSLSSHPCSRKVPPGSRGHNTLPASSSHIMWSPAGISPPQ